MITAHGIVYGGEGKNDSFFFSVSMFFPSYFSYSISSSLSYFLFLSRSFHLFAKRRRISELLLLANSHTNVEVYFEVTSIWYEMQLYGK